MTPVLADPFLAAHQLDPLVFDICWGLAPVSIRDQMLRGSIIAQRLVKARLIGPAEPLLVVGAGMAGVTAALTAAALKVPTHLVESQKILFALQRQCATRYLHPCQYDWPLPHWESSSFPDSEDWPRLLFAYQANYASQLAKEWKTSYLQACSAISSIHGAAHLKVFTNLKVENYTHVASGQRVQVTFSHSDSPDKPTLNSFAALVSAAGFGAERVQARSGRPHSAGGRSSPGAVFKSVGFWQTDTLSQLDEYGTPRIVIVGAGDGALQDFLRVVGGQKSAASLFSRLMEGPATQTARPIIERAIQAAEDQAQRAAMWAEPNSTEDHSIQLRLHETHRAQVNRLLDSPGVGDEIIPLFQAMIKKQCYQQITLIYGCNHFPQTYALNRFLVCLVEELTKRASLQKRIEIMPETGIHYVDCIDHDPDPHNPKACCGRPHELYLEGRQCLKAGTSKTVSSTPIGADLVVLRLGIERGDEHPVKSRPRVPHRQMLPYMPPYPVI
ncbi:hypothetical protein HPP05_37440 [Corallococcus exiguus]|uniref:hypothetical protein n=1 Tax=Corallococcus exiguus TaxID=83462 RepID=UPI001493EF32|nr:hypothetical protein [Corallococcus exiguus]NPC75443.1 hypothetical protein [Corallococcus exiguus]